MKGYLMKDYLKTFFSKEKLKGTHLAKVHVFLSVNYIAVGSYLIFFY